MSPGCGCDMQTPPPASMTQPFALPNGGALLFTRRNKKRGGGCGCMARRGGYRATAKNRKYVRQWKQGKSIGFTMRSSLKAKGLIPRASGKKVVSPKYK